MDDYETLLGVPSHLAAAGVRLEGTDEARRTQALPLARQPKTGDHLRFIFRARLLRGSELTFGFGRAMAEATHEKSSPSFQLSLLADGTLAYRVNDKPSTILDLTHTTGEWQHYGLDYVVGADLVLVTVGRHQLTVPTQPGAINRVILTADKGNSAGEFDGLRGAVVIEPGMRVLPVFGSIRWTRSDLPFIAPGPKAGVSGAGFSAVAAHLYHVGGFIPIGDETTDAGRRTSRFAYQYEPARKAWTRLPDLPARREYGVSASSATTLYFAGGARQQPKPYTPAADLWALDLTRDDPAWRALPSLTVPRTHLAFELLGDHLIAAGGNEYDFAAKGYGPTTIRDTVEVLDLNALSAGWKRVAPMPPPSRGWTAAVAARGKLFLFGGLTFQSTGPERSGTKKTRLRETLVLDLESNRWTSRTPPPCAVSGWRAALYRDRYAILIGGTLDTGTPPAYRWNAQPLVYDTITDTWYRLDASATPPGGVYNDPGVAVVGSTLFVAGGEAIAAHYNTLLTGEIVPHWGDPPPPGSTAR